MIEGRLIKITRKYEGFPVLAIFICPIKIKITTPMRRVVFIFGSIAGVIVVGLMYMLFSIGQDSSDFGTGELLGYLSMIIALSTIFFGVKSYRDSLGGVISFGKALLVGVLITLVASVIYIIGWEIYFNFFYSDFSQEYLTHSVEKLKASGVSGAELEKQVTEMKEMSDLYTNNVFFRMLITLIEILPVGVIISLISAALLRKKEFLPAS